MVGLKISMRSAPLRLARNMAISLSRSMSCAVSCVPSCTTMPIEAVSTISLALIFIGVLSARLTRSASVATTCGSESEMSRMAN